MNGTQGRSRGVGQPAFDAQRHCRLTFQLSASRQLSRPSALLAVEQIAHGAAAGSFKPLSALPAMNEAAPGPSELQERCTPGSDWQSRACLAGVQILPRTRTGFNRKRHRFHDNASVEADGSRAYGQWSFDNKVYRTMVFANSVNDFLSGLPVLQDSRDSSPHASPHVLPSLENPMSKKIELPFPQCTSDFLPAEIILLILPTVPRAGIHVLD